MWYKRLLLALLFAGMTSPALAERRTVFLEDGSGARIEIAALAVKEDGTYNLNMVPDAFSDHFLSMRPFKCIDGTAKTWCHVPYPYEIKRDVSADLTDLEYDLLFLWKRSNDYGIDMWNGVYYKLTDDGERIVGKIYEMDMNVLSVPPETGNLRPIREVDLTEGDVDSHWLPRVVIE